MYGTWNEIDFEDIKIIKPVAVLPETVKETIEKTPLIKE